MAQPLPETSFDPAKLYLWVKSLESKTNALLREVDLLKNNFIKKNDDLRKDVKVLSTELLELKHQHQQTQQKMDFIIKELQQTGINHSF